MGLTDRVATSLKQFSHVKITHPRHAYYGQTGTVVRIDLARRKVWVSLPGGQVVPAGHRSVEVIVPRPQR
jgi:hypothetical protein